MIDNNNLSKEVRMLRNQVSELASIQKLLFRLIEAEIITWPTLVDTLLFYAAEESYVPQIDVVPDDIRCPDSFRAGIAYAQSTMVYLDRGEMAVKALEEVDVLEISVCDDETPKDEQSGEGI